jgi:hypothetical protein
MSEDEARPGKKRPTVDDFDFDAEQDDAGAAPLDLATERRRPQTLDMAMRVWGDPTLVAKLAEAERVGPLRTLASIFGSETWADRRTLPFTMITDLLRAALLEKLRDGRLSATGFERGAPVHAPPSGILAERWHCLIPDFSDSSATGAGIFLSGIRVREPGSVPDVPTDELGRPPAFSQPITLVASTGRGMEDGDPEHGASSQDQQVSDPGTPELARPLMFEVDGVRGEIRFAGGPVLRGRHARIIVALLPAYHAGLQAGTGLDAFKFCLSPHLADALKLSDQSLRQYLSGLRRELEAQFDEAFGIKPGSDDVVQSKKPHGYRLNPDLRQVASLGSP